LKEIIDFSDLTSLKLAENSKLKKLLDFGGSKSNLEESILEEEKKPKAVAKKIAGWWGKIKVKE